MPVQGNKIFFEFDPFELTGMPKPKSGIREAKQRCADLVLEEVLNTVGQARSPVAGESWKSSLSKGYKAVKGDYSSNLTANMELHGDLLDNLECVVNPKGRLELRNTGRQTGKADGHNNHSGQSSLPQRRYIPDTGQTFKRDIIEKMKVILSDYVDEDSTDFDDEDEDEDGEEI